MDLRRAALIGGGYPLAFLSTGIAALALLPFRPFLTGPTVMLLFVPVIIGVARVAGVRPSATAAVLAFLALDQLFVPPYYHLTVASLPEWLGLLVFLFVALVSGQQTARLRARSVPLCGVRTSSSYSTGWRSASPPRRASRRSPSSSSARWPRSPAPNASLYTCASPPASRRVASRALALSASLQARRR